ncbi:MAG: hypothetical protein KIT43_12795 [Bauldia sp.]|nr:hypothetical protein [Bauldia sp.]
MADWLTDQVRLTLFLEKPLNEHADGAWQVTTGSLPETDVSKPRDASRRQAGAWNDGVLAINTQATRIDWVYTPSPDDGGPAGFATNAPERVTALVGVAHQWLGKIGAKVLRAALAPVYYDQVAGRLEGYRAIEERVPWLRDISREGISDITLQINPLGRIERPLPLTINRVSRWAVAAVSPFTIGVEDDAVRANATADTRHYLRIDLDLNTRPMDQAAVRELNPDEVVAILYELAAAGIGIAEQGLR